jgi:hypothetical protein
MRDPKTHAPAPAAALQEHSKAHTLVDAEEVAELVYVMSLINTLEMRMLQSWCTSWAWGGEITPKPSAARAQGLSRRPGGNRRGTRPSSAVLPGYHQGVDEECCAHTTACLMPPATDLARWLLACTAGPRQAASQGHQLHQDEGWGAEHAAGAPGSQRSVGPCAARGPDRAHAK